MYSEWPSVTNEVLDINKCRSVLNTYGPQVGKEVARSVVSSLLGICFVADPVSFYNWNVNVFFMMSN